MTAIVGGIPSVPGIGPTELVGANGLPGAPSATQGAGGVSFSSLLSDKLNGVIDLQQQADAASQAVASGQSSDLAGATVAVEKASIAIELAGSLRNKAVEAYQDVMRMQV